MSPIAAILKAVKTELLALVGGDHPERVVKVTFDGQPDPVCGQWFYAVHPGRVSGISESPQYAEHSYDVDVTITRKVGATPRDRIGESLLLATSELLDRMEAVRARIHGNYTLMLNANADSGNFYHPLLFSGASSIQARGADWFFAEDANEPPSGLSITVSFHKATLGEDLR